MARFIFTLMVVLSTVVFTSNVVHPDGTALGKVIGLFMVVFSFAGSLLDED